MMIIQVNGKIMVAAAKKLAVKLDRITVGEFFVSLDEFNTEYNCEVGPQQFGNGLMINDREVKFSNEAEATLFLLRWS